MTINIQSYGILNQHYQKRIKATFIKALSEHPRTLMVRADLYLPDSSFNADSKQISRFYASLKAQVEADLKKRTHKGVRVHPCKVRYIWVREFCRSGFKHYHVALFFNKDTYAYPGTYRPQNEREYIDNLSLMIMEAWVRALNLHQQEKYQQYYSLIHFPISNYRHLNANSPDAEIDKKQVLDWLAYFAKKHSKDSSDGQRNFGCSQY